MTLGKNLPDFILNSRTINPSLCFHSAFLLTYELIHFCVWLREAIMAFTSLWANILRGTGVVMHKRHFDSFVKIKL